MLLRLLYRTAEWHALAKLRIHTDSTLDLLQEATRELGRLLRQFRDRTSDEFDTVELPSKTGTEKKGGSSSKKKKLNLNTYKFHSLGDYVTTIRLFGTTDSYSTQLVSRVLYHAVFYVVTSSLAGRTRAPSCQEALRANKQTGRTRANWTPLSSRPLLRQVRIPRFWGRQSSRTSPLNQQLTKSTGPAGLFIE